MRIITSKKQMPSLILEIDVPIGCANYAKERLAHNPEFEWLLGQDFFPAWFAHKDFAFRVVAVKEDNPVVVLQLTRNQRTNLTEEL